MHDVINPSNTPITALSWKLHILTKWGEVANLCPPSIMSTDPVAMLPHIGITNTFGKRYSAYFSGTTLMMKIYGAGATLIGAFIAAMSVLNLFQRTLILDVPYCTQAVWLDNAAGIPLNFSHHHWSHYFR